MPIAKATKKDWNWIKGLIDWYILIAFFLEIDVVRVSWYTFIQPCEDGIGEMIKDPVRFLHVSKVMHCYSVVLAVNHYFGTKFTINIA
jgi:hypothetical protein